MYMYMRLYLPLYNHCTQCAIEPVADLMACVLYRRHVDRQQLRRCPGVKSKVAKTLAQNIASLPAPPTSELVETHISRKNMNQGDI